jgi:sugar lactone lactonase YvrE
MKQIVFTMAAIALTAAHAAAQDHKLADILLDGEGWELVSAGHQFTEGPAPDAAGNVYFTDVRGSRIHKIDAATGKPSVWKENTERTNGLMFDAAGRLLGCQAGRNRIIAMDSAGAESELAAGDWTPNDLVVAHNGVYFTAPDKEPAKSRVYFLPTGGKPAVIEQGIPRPNGIMLSPDGGTLFVADTMNFVVWTYLVRSDGSVHGRAPYARLRGARPQMVTAPEKRTDADGRKITVQKFVETVVRPENERSGADGMTVDRAGRLYVTSTVGLQVFDPTGREVGLIAPPAGKKLSNVAFGGPKLDTLYVTAGDSVYRRKTRTAGFVYPGSR